jgi:hypothetical protein
MFPISLFSRITSERSHSGCRPHGPFTVVVLLMMLVVRSLLRCPCLYPLEVTDLSFEAAQGSSFLNSLDPAKAASDVACHFLNGDLGTIRCPTMVEAKYSRS